MRKESQDKLNVKAYLTFRIGNELYATDVKSVINIVELSKIIKVSHVPDYVLGIVNLRGTILPVIDTRKKFGIESTEFTINSCILILELIINNKNIQIGALVDGVKEVIEIDNSEINVTSTFEINNSKLLIAGVYKNTNDENDIKILNMNKLFSYEEINSLTNNGKGQQVELIQ